MAKFRVTLGRDATLYATVWVDAETQEDAERIAHEMLGDQFADFQWRLEQTQASKVLFVDWMGD